jgi:hypothetical protein
VHCAIYGDDSDFVVGGDLAKLDFRPAAKGLADANADHGRTVSSILATIQNLRTTGTVRHVRKERTLSFYRGAGAILHCRKGLPAEAIGLAESTSMLAFFQHALVAFSVWARTDYAANLSRSNPADGG